MWQCALTVPGRSALPGRRTTSAAASPPAGGGPDVGDAAVGDRDGAPGLEAPVDQDEVGGEAHHPESVGGTERPVTGASRPAPSDAATRST